MYVKEERISAGGRHGIASFTKQFDINWKIFIKNIDIYFLLIPGLVFLIIFKYIPMGGLIMAFQDFNIFAGFLGSKWVGLAHFHRLFTSEEFYMVFRNTLVISLYKLVILFPIPIFIAIVLNEIRNMAYKRTVQTIIYLPHFLSWVIISGLFINILSPSSGIVNQLIRLFGGQPVAFMMEKAVFRGVLVFTQGWKEAGWGAIIYIAAIAGIDQQLYEAAKVDGAGRLKQIWHITIPGISSTIVLMLILRLGYVMEAGFEQVLMMYNPTVYDVADIIQTYVYRMGLGKMEYSFSSAVGMFNSLIGFILIVSGNFLSKRLVGKSIW